MLDLIASQYHYSDRHMLGLPLGRLRQMSAAIGLRLHEQDLAARRLATVQLRTVCAYVAATMQLAEGTDNVMLAEAAGLHLGPGTENPAMAPAAPAVPEGPVRPGARLRLDELPDGPAGVRVGRADPAGAGDPHAGLTVLPLDRIGKLFGGGL